MKCLILILALFSVNSFSCINVYSQTPVKDNGSRQTGYKTSDCENKCAGNQQCTLNAEDERYYCRTSKAAGSSVSRQLEVYISCKDIGGIHKTKCTSLEIPVSSLSGKSEIPVRSFKPGQCCILKSKLKVY